MIDTSLQQQHSQRGTLVLNNKDKLQMCELRIIHIANFQLICARTIYDSLYFYRLLCYLFAVQ